MSGPWGVLDLAPSSDRNAIRRAYAAKLRTTNPEDDPVGFQALREAYEFALSMCEQRADWNAPPDDAAEPTASTSSATSAVAAPQPVFAEPMRLFNELEQMLASSQTSTADALRACLVDLLARPEMENVDFRADIEHRIAELIVQSSPRSDPIAVLAMNFFGWGQQNPQARCAPDAEGVRQRASDLDYLRDIERRKLPAFDAYLELQKPAGFWRRAWLRLHVNRLNELKEFIDSVNTHRWSLMHNVDEKAFVYWNAFLHRPHLTGLGLVTVCMLGFCLGFASLFWFGIGIGLGMGPTPYIAIGVGGAVTVAGIYFYGVAWPRTFWLERWKWQAPAWVRTGWAPASFILLWVAVALPSAWWSTAIVAAVAASIALWALATGERDTREGGIGWRTRGALNQGLLLIWWVFMMLNPIEAPPIHLTLAIAAAAVASYAGAETLDTIWTVAWSSWLRIAMLVLLLLDVVGAIILLGIVGERPALAPVAATAIATAVLLHRVPAYWLHGGAMTLRHYVMYFGAIIVMRPGGSVGDVPLLVRGGVLLLAGVLMVWIVAVAREIQALFREWRGAPPT